VPRVEVEFDESFGEALVRVSTQLG
jgi:hypothetical protein